MSVYSNMQTEDKLRIIQELVPGKQITIAHIIANPDEALFESAGIYRKQKSAIAILTLSPAESAIIAGDIAMKAAGVSIASIDRASGCLILTGTVSELESAVSSLVSFARDKMDFTVCDITKT